MSSLISALGNNAKALAAHSKAVEIAGKNLANVNNPSYARETVTFGSAGSIQTAYGMESMGTEITAITSTRNAIIDSQLLRETMTQNSLKAQAESLNLLQSALGEVISTSTPTGSKSASLYSSIDSFFSAFQSLSADPSSDAAKQEVLAQGQGLVDQFHYISGRLSTIDSDLATQIDSQVSTVNGLLQEVADLNNQIGKSEVNAPGSAMDLRDAREGKLEELAKYISFKTENVGDGTIRVTTTGTAGADVSLVDRATVTGAVAYTGTGFTAGTPAVAISPTGGSLAGLQGIRGGVLVDLRADTDALASQFVTTVNATYGANFFRTDIANPALYRTAADIQLDPALTAATLRTGASADAGDNSIARAIADLASHQFTAADAITGTFAGFYQNKVTAVGQGVATATNQLSNSTLVFNTLSNQRDSASAASTDEEMTDLMKFQRAYQGTARVINVMDSMLEIIVSRLGNF